MSLRQNHLYGTPVQHVACDTPVPPNGTGNELTIKVASQGRPAIGLFTELSQRHVASACHTRGRNCACDILSPRRVPWIQTDLNSCDRSLQHVAASNCIKTYISVTRGDLWRGRVAAISRGDRSPRVLVLLKAVFYFKCLALFTVYKLTCMRK